MVSDFFVVFNSLTFDVGVDGVFVEGPDCVLNDLFTFGAGSRLHVSVIE